MTRNCLQYFQFVNVLMWPWWNYSSNHSAVAQNTHECLSNCSYTHTQWNNRKSPQTQANIVKRVCEVNRFHLSFDGHLRSAGPSGVTSGLIPCLNTQSQTFDRIQTPGWAQSASLLVFPERPHVLHARQPTCECPDGPAAFYWLPVC